MEIEKKMEWKEKKQRNHDQRNPSFSWWTTTTTTTTNSHGVNRTKPRIRVKDWREETKKKRKILGKNGTSLPPWKRGEDELRFSNPKRKRKKQRENTRNETRLTNITRDRRYATATIHHQPSKRTNQPIDSKIIYVGYTYHGGGGGGRRGERGNRSSSSNKQYTHTLLPRAEAAGDERRPRAARPERDLLPPPLHRSSPPPPPPVRRQKRVAAFVSAAVLGAARVSPIPRGFYPLGFGPCGCGLGLGWTARVLGFMLMSLRWMDGWMETRCGCKGFWLGART